MYIFSILSAAAAALPLANAYTWKNVVTGGGGGFTPGIVFSNAAKGVAYARTDIGGLYRLNADDSWTPLTDYANTTSWNNWGIDALAADPTNAKNVYVAVGMYTNSWDPNNGAILRSKDSGNTWASAPLPFKVGGNMPGRGMGERLAVDPKLSSVLYFGARSGKGLWKSTVCISDFFALQLSILSYTKNFYRILVLHGRT
jgi:xyloglucan-specific exo-beta-1,4-glucanase